MLKGRPNLLDRLVASVLQTGGDESIAGEARLVFGAGLAGLVLGLAGAAFLAAWDRLWLSTAALVIAGIAADGLLSYRRARSTPRLRLLIVITGFVLTLGATATTGGLRTTAPLTGIPGRRRQ